MHFSTLSLAATLLTLTSATPTLSSRSTAFCPGQSQITPDVGCSSGFLGCVAYEAFSATCNGAKRFFNDCSGAPGLGSFFRCEAAGVVTFIGCSTNPKVCDTKLAGNTKPVDTTTTTTPPKTATTPKTETTASKWTCPAGTWYARPGECSSGFVGCTGTSPTVCPGEKRFWGTCPPNHGNYYKCANGFVGCTTITAICG